MSADERKTKQEGEIYEAGSRKQERKEKRGMRNEL
jgi:hypothetical protein